MCRKKMLHVQQLVKKNTGSAVYAINSSATLMLLLRLRMLPVLIFPQKVINTIAKAPVLYVV